ncbi:Low-temperature-induced 65 kDa protein [Acorus gramineus]|uniref:Low-temperature-induced 65 kDa protein n=1 Tax=Acorus gramineus TaxID=55184 RepID=A0AAV9A8T8_ACOGR|nr:Low-temperature-induced 65 kDa protein [Acorus gramineus]
MDSPANYEAKTTDPSSTGGAEAQVGPVTRSFQEMKVSEEPEKTEDSPTRSHDQFSPTTPPSEPTPTQAKPEPTPSHPQSYTEQITSAASAISGKASSAASTVYEAVAGKTVKGPEEGKGKEDKGVSVRDYLVGKLSPGEEDKALSEVISDVIHKRREGETLVGTEGVVETEKGVVRKEEGVVGKIKGAVTSLFKKGESGGGSSSSEVQQGK